MADILAIQSLYGAPATVNPRSSIYGFGSTATGYLDFGQFTQGNMVAFTIFDSGGIDALNASRFTGPQIINLQAGAYSSIGGEIGNIGIAENTVIERAVGGSGNDLILGNLVANQLQGGLGDDVLQGLGANDVLYGGGGTDTLQGGDGDDFLYGETGADRLDGGLGVDFARYDNANWGNLVIRLDLPSANTGSAAGDTYVGIEGIIAGIGNDAIYGNAAANQLLGGEGADSLYGAGGNDYLKGGLGADRHDGSVGTDYAAYDDGNWGDLVVNLLKPHLNTGAAAGDTYVDIEGIVGGAGNDTITGNSTGNQLLGGAGNDILDGLGGNDFLTGGAGADDFLFTTAAGTGNLDRILDFEHGVDDIVLKRNMFVGIGETLDASEFGAKAGPTTFIVYQQAAGKIYFDAGGNDAGAVAVLVAAITPGTVLDINDFVMI
jgi:serralysin